MSTAASLCPERQEDAYAIFNRLRSLGNLSVQQRELLDAGVSMRRIDHLYPFDFDEIAPVLTMLIQRHGLKHLKAQQRLSMSTSTYAALYSPDAFGLSDEQRARIREVFNNRAAEGSAPQQALFKVLERKLRASRSDLKAPGLMHEIWIRSWLLANRHHLGRGWGVSAIEGDYLLLLSELMPRFDEVLTKYEADLANPNRSLAIRASALFRGAS